MKPEDKQMLYNAYNATSTDDPPGSDILETYEAWLERQLIARMERIDELEKAPKIIEYLPSPTGILKYNFEPGFDIKIIQNELQQFRGTGILLLHPDDMPERSMQDKINPSEKV